jgi:hypothetical protein
MDNFLRGTQTLEWWISVVFIGILLNIIATFIYKKTPRLLGRVSTSWAERDQRARAAIQAKIVHLSQHAELRERLFRDELRGRLRSTFLGLIGAILLLAGFRAEWAFLQDFAQALGAFFCILGFIEYWKAISRGVEAEHAARVASERERGHLMTLKQH